MKQWQIVWDSAVGEVRAMVRARDAEHAIKVWKRDHANGLGVRAISQVWRASR